jgi:hypothetical protein
MAQNNFIADQIVQFAQLVSSITSGYLASPSTAPFQGGHFNLDVPVVAINRFPDAANITGLFGQTNGGVFGISAFSNGPRQNLPTGYSLHSEFTNNGADLDFHLDFGNPYGKTGIFGMGIPKHVGVDLLKGNANGGQNCLDPAYQAGR